MYFVFNSSICSDLYIIKDFIQEVVKKLYNIIKDDSIMFDIKLILNELIINGVIHGNKYNKKKCINLYIKLVNDCITIEVTDEGEGFKYNVMQYDALDLKCSGRGLIIIKGLTDEFYVCKNKVIVVKYLHIEGGRT